MTSPVQDFEPFEDEGELLGDVSQADQPEEEEGEELFGDNMEKYVVLRRKSIVFLIVFVYC